MEKGIAGFFYGESQTSKFDEKHLEYGIKVEDTLQFFQSLAREWRLQFLI